MGIKWIILILILVSCSKAEIHPPVLHFPNYWKTCDGVNFEVRSVYSHNVGAKCFTFRDLEREKFPKDAVLVFGGVSYTVDQLIYCTH